mgnify:CR=1 FL=1
MGNEKINSIDYKELYAQYNWFSNAYPPAVQASSDEFFLPGLKFILIGISKNINTLMDKDAYFVTKIRIDKLHDMFFRTSEKAIGIILDRVLGKPNSRFNLNKLTDLEAKIITAFNDYMFNATSQFLTQAPPSLKRTNFDVVHLTFLLKDEDTNAVAKFIITLPDELLAPEAVTSQSDKFDYGDFASSVIDVAVKVGSTKFKLIDIKNIDVDDIVVFDNSDIKHMVLKFKDYETDININPNLGLVMPVDNDGGNEEMAGENTNLWDSIEVEMDAQFDTVKITLGELKNIEKGLVVDLTSIYDNKVTLSVENKPIARGELVIVNDRYGVKIDEVIAKTPKTQNTQVESTQNEEITETQPSDFDESNMEFQEEDTPAAPAQNSDEEDEFDYSDFELEDEDI